MSNLPDEVERCLEPQRVITTEQIMQYDATPRKVLEYVTHLLSAGRSELL